jgi:hypothetical protein
MQLILLGTFHGEEYATVKLYVPAEFRAVSCSSDEIELLVIRRASTLAVLFFVYISRQSVYLPAYYSTVLCTGAVVRVCVHVAYAPHVAVHRGFVDSGLSPDALRWFRWNQSCSKRVGYRKFDWLLKFYHILYQVVLHF